MGGIGVDFEGRAGSTCFFSSLSPCRRPHPESSREKEGQEPREGSAGACLQHGQFLREDGFLRDPGTFPLPCGA